MNPSLKQKRYDYKISKRKRAIKCLDLDLGKDLTRRAQKAQAIKERNEKLAFLKIK